jgi:glycyl-tRNA synthetase
MAEQDVFSKVMELAKRRGFLWPSYEVYGGVAGFYDYGPLGAQLRLGIENLWRRYYVGMERFAEISAPVISPEGVFRASGHLEKFADVMTECSKCGEASRADHLLKEKYPEEAAGTMETIARAIKEHDVRCPSCKGELGEPFQFNLMFRTNVGPGMKRVGYLRPETAQAMFMDFTLLYHFFRDKLPFGAVQLGRGYRNEIAPRQGIIRLREFHMAEAEIFVDPKEKGKHPRFSNVAGDVLHLVPNKGLECDLSIGDAVKKGVIANEWVGYYVGITSRFLLEAGVDQKRLRFRQHASTEMAHYAADCWDAEVQLSFGWTEVVGVADRTSYDLEAHMRVSGVDLRAFNRFDTPKTVEKVAVVPNPAKLGPKFKGQAKAIALALSALDGNGKEGAEFLDLKIDGKDVRVEKDGFTVKKVTETVNGEWFTPHVIEPSYGIDRILYSVLEHAYFETKKEGEDYVVLRLKPAMAPVTVGILPLMGKDELLVVAADIDARLRSAGLTTYSDDSGSIGRRYARMDEVGTPYCVTVDFDGLKDGTVTVRDRDTTKQVRVPVTHIVDIIRELMDGKRTLEQELAR